MVRFSEDLIWYGKDFQILGEGISNFSFQILLDLNLEFIDSVYISLALDDSSFLVWKCPLWN